MAGFFFGAVFLVRLGDIIGRKKLIVASTLINSATLFGVIFSPNIISVFSFVFIYGLTCGPRNLSYVYALELTSSDYESLYSTISMLFDSTAMLVLGIYFYFVKSMNPLLYFIATI